MGNQSWYLEAYRKKHKWHRKQEVFDRHSQTLLTNAPKVKVQKRLFNFVFQDVVVLLAAEEKKEQLVEITEEAVELTEVSSQPKNEEGIEIIPVQEEEEETEMNFPEPPQDQEPSPIENDSIP